jgi:hypothetical protein
MFNNKFQPTYQLFYKEKQLSYLIFFDFVFKNVFS